MQQAKIKHPLAYFITTFCLICVSSQAQAAEKTGAGKVFHDCPGCPEMVVIPSGSFEMGSPDSEEGRADDEGPVHRVKISSFAMSRTEITRGQFAEFVNHTKYKAGDKCLTLENGKVAERKGGWLELKYVQGDHHPIGCINQADAKAYSEWISRKTGKRYRLPTEAEWEYAARGLSTTARYWGDNPDDACSFANVADKTAQAKIVGATSWTVHNCTDSFDYTAPVGKFKANAFGLHDMLGNSWEWTADSYHDSYKEAPTNGSAWHGKSEKGVLRGGSWNNGPRNVRSAGRNSYEFAMRFSFFGFRVAREIPLLR
jgi:formylglycine-generating enzyme required for sulfatase activity